MADVPELGDLLRRNVESGLRFYQGLVRLSADYLKEMSAAFVDSGGAVEDSPAPASHASAMVLEAEAGQQAQGFFLVENNTSRRVSAEVVASPLIDPEGNEVEQRLDFEPAKVSLGPSEQTVVRVFGEIDARLQAGVGCRGVLAVPGVSKATAAIVVRRLHGVERAGRADEPAPKKAPAMKAAPKRAASKRKTLKRPAAKKPVRKKPAPKRATTKKATAKKTAAKARGRKKTAARSAAKKGAGRSASRTGKK